MLLRAMLPLRLMLRNAAANSAEAHRDRTVTVDMLAETNVLQGKFEAGLQNVDFGECRSGPGGRGTHHQRHRREVCGHLRTRLAQHGGAVALLAVAGVYPNPDVDLAAGQLAEHHADLFRS